MQLLGPGLVKKIHSSHMGDNDSTIKNWPWTEEAKVMWLPVTLNARPTMEGPSANQERAGCCLQIKLQAEQASGTLKFEPWGLAGNLDGRL